MGDAADRVRRDWVSSLQHCRSGNGRRARYRGPLASHLTDCQMVAANRCAWPFHIRRRENAAFSEAERAACGFAPSHGLGLLRSESDIQKASPWRPRRSVEIGGDSGRVIECDVRGA